MKRRHLTLYNYGMGGILCYIYAESFDDIKGLYPELELIEDEEAYFRALPVRNLVQPLRHKLEQHHTYDLAEEPSGFLRGLIEQRQRNQ